MSPASVNPAPKTATDTARFLFYPRLCGDMSMDTLGYLHTHCHSGKQHDKRGEEEKFNGWGKEKGRGIKERIKTSSQNTNGRQQTDICGGNVSLPIPASALGLKAMKSPLISISEGSSCYRYAEQFIRTVTLVLAG
ncbi:hypothetical protein BaRGS_00009317 [Batillaria attramentaria]|uniref:Uncharacterized protein n=1 Tax=Batillaria attramentaria TaxID=370345 RepID=A0ABD0LJ31_9CAEN